MGKFIHPIGALIDDIRHKTPKSFGNKDENGYYKRAEYNGKKIPYHFWLGRIFACIRILRGKGMVVYYKEDE